MFLNMSYDKIKNLIKNKIIVTKILKNVFGNEFNNISIPFKKDTSIHGKITKNNIFFSEFNNDKLRGINVFKLIDYKIIDEKEKEFIIKEKLELDYTLFKELTKNKLNQKEKDLIKKEKEDLKKEINIFYNIIKKYKKNESKYLKDRKLDYETNYKISPFEINLEKINEIKKEMKKEKVTKIIKLSEIKENPIVFVNENTFERNIDNIILRRKDIKKEKKYNVLGSLTTMVYYSKDSIGTIICEGTTDFHTLIKLVINKSIPSFNIISEHSASSGKSLKGMNLIEKSDIVITIGDNDWAGKEYEKNIENYIIEYFLYKKSKLPLLINSYDLGIYKINGVYDVNDMIIKSERYFVKLINKIIKEKDEKERIKLLPIKKTINNTSLNKKYTINQLREMNLKILFKYIYFDLKIEDDEVYEIENEFTQEEKENYYLNIISLKELLLKKKRNELIYNKKIVINYYLKQMKEVIIKQIKKEMEKEKINNENINFLKRELSIYIEFDKIENSKRKKELELIISSIILIIKKIKELNLIYNIRGSANNLYLLYNLGITKTNPLDDSLIMNPEVFININKLPDIDIEINKDEKDLLIKELNKDFLLKKALVVNKNNDSNDHPCKYFYNIPDKYLKYNELTYLPFDTKNLEKEGFLNVDILSMNFDNIKSLKKIKYTKKQKEIAMNKRDNITYQSLYFNNYMHVTSSFKKNLTKIYNLEKYYEYEKKYIYQDENKKEYNLIQIYNIEKYKSLLSSMKIKLKELENELYYEENNKNILYLTELDLYTNKLKISIVIELINDNKVLQNNLNIPIEIEKIEYINKYSNIERKEKTKNIILNKHLLSDLIALNRPMFLKEVFKIEDKILLIEEKNEKLEKRYKDIKNDDIYIGNINYSSFEINGIQKKEKDIEYFLEPKYIEIKRESEYLLNKYIDNKNKKLDYYKLYYPKYLHSTNGIIIYHEQLMNFLEEFKSENFSSNDIQLIFDRMTKYNKLKKNIDKYKKSEILYNRIFNDDLLKLNYKNKEQEKTYKKIITEQLYFLLKSNPIFLKKGHTLNIAEMILEENYYSTLKYIKENYK